MEYCENCRFWRRLNYDMGYCYNEEKEINEPAKQLTGEDEWCIYYQEA